MWLSCVVWIRQLFIEFCSVWQCLYKGFTNNRPESLRILPFGHCSQYAKYASGFISLFNFWEGGGSGGERDCFFIGAVGARRELKLLWVVDIHRENAYIMNGGFAF